MCVCVCDEIYSNGMLEMKIEWLKNLYYIFYYVGLKDFMYLPVQPMCIIYKQKITVFVEQNI